jgi:hypothetical protein
MTPNVTGAPSRVVAPATMTAQEKREFNSLIDSCAADHFRQSDVPVIENYIRATLLARKTAGKPKLFSVFEKSVRLQLSCATKLRLLPSTRTHPDKITRAKSNQQGSVSWADDDAPYSRAELDDDEDDHARH